MLESGTRAVEFSLSDATDRTHKLSAALSTKSAADMFTVSGASAMMIAVSAWPACIASRFSFGDRNLRSRPASGSFAGSETT